MSDDFISSAWQRWFNVGWMIGKHQNDIEPSFLLKTFSQATFSDVKHHTRAKITPCTPISRDIVENIPNHFNYKFGHSRHSHTFHPFIIRPLNCNLMVEWSRFPVYSDLVVKGMFYCIQGTGGERSTLLYLIKWATQALLNELLKPYS